ncbi:MAG: hypothetical protein J5989_01295 [Alistipes sp.]|nr:hypothetical protein [Alistipes sp.]
MGYRERSALVSYMLIDIYRQSVSRYIYYKAVEGLPLDRSGSHFLFMCVGLI